ncbi:BTAD domain-containing putative transcriptional regulator [Mycolicibacterium sp. XJ662]
MFVQPDRLDTARFERRLRAGQEALRVGDPVRASELLGDALRLWRGAVLEDLGQPQFAAAETARLDELRLVATEYRIDADLALGRHHAVISELQRLAAAHPYREQVHCRLMLALYRSGRQADALAVAASARRRLCDELGVDPGPALRDLETEILRHDPSLLHTVDASPRSDAAPPAAVTKYRPSTPTRRLVRRPRLIDAVRADGPRRLIVIHGPAGFGKTTLAVQWREALVEEGVAVAWLTVDDDDNNEVRFLAHLIDAVRTVRPSLALELRQALEERGAAATRYALTALINDIETNDAPTCVVIDDWHRITDDATTEVMAYLLDHSGPHLQVVVTTRSRSGLPLGRMRVRDELVEIDSAALRFDTSESHTLLVELGGLALTGSEVAKLERTTEGWVAALQLASLSLRNCDDPTALIERMSGRHHAIGEYLAENVLDSLDPEMLDFLRATSVVERVSGDLASALAGVTNGQALLEDAERRDLFLRRLDDEREWFCYHQLFAEFLRRRLEYDQPQRIPGLHATASKWFADHNLLREAISHAVAAGDEDRAIDLIERHEVDLEQQAQLSTLRALVATLPPKIPTPSPRLQLFLARAHSLLQQPEGARAALDGFETALEARNLSPSEVWEMRVEADVFRALAEVWTDRDTGVDELLSDCLSRPEALSPFVVGTAANVASFLEISRFDYAAARRWQDWAAEYHHRCGNSFVLIYGHCLAAIAASQQLDIVEAERRLREAVRIARQSQAPFSHAARVAYALLAEVLYERGELSDADRLLEDSGRFGTGGGPPVEFMIARCCAGARIKVAIGQHDAAHRLLDEGSQVARAVGLTRLGAAVEVERLRLNVPAESLNPIGSTPDDGLGAEITAQLRDEAEILRLLDTDPGLACERAMSWVKRLERQARPRALLQGNRLLVAALVAADRIDQATQLLAQLTAQCAEVGMVRYLADGGPQVTALT